MNRILLSIALFGTVLTMKSQTVISDFENVTLPNQNNHVYNDSLGGSGFSSGNAFLLTKWDTSFGGFWSSGWAASALYDSITITSAPDYSNLYGCIANKGYNNSNVFAVGQVDVFDSIHPNPMIKLTGNSLGKPVLGMYVTNSTYAYKSMEYGDSFAKKFGDTTGTHCACPQGSYPDWFKLTVNRYYHDTLFHDSVEVYLADFRFTNNAQDYILKTWIWIDLRYLGLTDSTGFTDSLLFTLHSSDNYAPGMMNTPAFFCIDNLTTNASTHPNEIQNYLSSTELNLFPNPAKDFFEIAYQTETPSFVSLKMLDITGRELLLQNFKSFNGLNKFKVETQDLPEGIYYVTLNVEGNIFSKKLIKQ